MAGYNNSGIDHIIIDVDKHCKKCIFRVPEVLRKQKSDAYTPYVVSIGPFHSQRKGGKGRKEGGMEGIQNKFQLMERTKEAYYINFSISCTIYLSKNLRQTLQSLQNKTMEALWGLRNEPAVFMQNHLIIFPPRLHPDDDS